MPHFVLLQDLLCLNGYEDVTCDIENLKYGDTEITGNKQKG